MTGGQASPFYVDTEGILYVRISEERFNPYYMTQQLFDQIPDDGFNKIISVPDPENPEEIKKIKAHQFGKRSVMVGKDGVLYLVANHEKLGLVSKAKGSSIRSDARSSPKLDLEYRAYKLAKVGYDSGCLQTARDYIAKSDLSDEEKDQFNTRLDQILEQ